MMCVLEVDLEQNAAVGKLPGALRVHIVAPCAGEDAAAMEACAQKVTVFHATRIQSSASVGDNCCIPDRPLSEHAQACAVHVPVDTALS
jgi:hypothetical protein